jgi:hypothetical protein
LLPEQTLRVLAVVHSPALARGLPFSSLRAPEHRFLTMTLMYWGALLPGAEILMHCAHCKPHGSTPVRATRRMN